MKVFLIFIIGMIQFVEPMRKEEWIQLIQTFTYNAMKILGDECQSFSNLTTKNEKQFIFCDVSLPTSSVGSSSPKSNNSEAIQDYKIHCKCCIIEREIGEYDFEYYDPTNITEHFLLVHDGENGLIKTGEAMLEKESTEWFPIRNTNLKGRAPCEIYTTLTPTNSNEHIQCQASPSQKSNNSRAIRVRKVRCDCFKTMKIVNEDGIENYVDINEVHDEFDLEPAGINQFNRA